MALWKYDNVFLWISVILMMVFCVAVSSLPQIAWIAGYVVALSIFCIAYVLAFKRGFRW